MEKQNQKNNQNRVQKQTVENTKKSFLTRNTLLIGLLSLIAVFFIYSKVSSNEDKGVNTINKTTETVNTTEGNEVILSSLNFEQQVLKSQKLVMVDFWATWCGPCRMTAPIVKTLADEYKGKIVVGKVDVDQNRDLAEGYSISAIPTILFFKDGKVVDQQIGMTSKENLEEKIKSLMK
jgi:thioredoxin 1